MTKTKTLHTSDSRGKADFGWLNSRHTFSFGNYYNPERMNFGVLRVLNDDIVASGAGFGRHPHQNMEIISIPLSGDLKHSDSTGRTEIIKEGDVQIMSAGTGIEHSEMNANSDKEVRFLQIWVMPNQQNVVPRYQQITLNTEQYHNKLAQILSPNEDDEGVWIYQDAWFHLGNFDSEKTFNHSLNKKENGLYVFVLEGSATVEDTELEKRDGLGLVNKDTVRFQVNPNSKLLLMEVPLLS